MDYIFKTDFLSLSNHKKSTNIQYLYWAEKKRLQKQKTQYDTYVKQWYTISQEQQKDKKKHESKPAKTKSIQENSSFVRHEELYYKNLQWKHNVDMKINKIRMEKKQEEQRKEKREVQGSRSKEKLYESQHNNYKGPVKAWKERFDSYLKSKSGTSIEEEQQYFHPSINKNSRLITNNMVGKVQDRLISYGQKLKEKKAEMQIIYEEQLFLQRNSIKDESMEGNSEEVYWRLYKDGEKINKKRNQYKSEFTFVPEINKNSAALAEKMASKRKPLHQQGKNNTLYDIQQKQMPEKREKHHKQKSFNNFLKRNQVLLDKIQKHKQKKAQSIKEKQKKQSKECTFKPNLNQKSLKMVKSYEKQNQMNHYQNKNSNQQSINFDSSSNLFKKQYFFRSQNNEILDPSKQLLTTERQRISRLNSDGNIKIKNDQNPSYIGDQDSISYVHHNHHKRQYQPLSNSLLESLNKRTPDRSRQILLEEELFATDRNHDKTQIYHINEVLEQDSIQRQKEDDWQNELMRMERQIEDMLHRTPTK